MSLKCTSNERLNAWVDEWMGEWIEWQFSLTSEVTRWRPVRSRSQPESSLKPARPENTWRRVGPAASSAQCWKQNVNNFHQKVKGHKNPGREVTTTPEMQFTNKQPITELHLVRPEQFKSVKLSDCSRGSWVLKYLRKKLISQKQSVNNSSWWSEHKVQSGSVIRERPESLSWRASRRSALKTSTSSQLATLQTAKSWHHFLFSFSIIITKVLVEPFKTRQFVSKHKNDSFHKHQLLSHKIKSEVLVLRTWSQQYQKFPNFPGQAVVFRTFWWIFSKTFNRKAAANGSIFTRTHSSLITTLFRWLLGLKSSSDLEKKQEVMYRFRITSESCGSCKMAASSSRTAVFRSPSRAFSWPSAKALGQSLYGLLVLK